MQPAAALAVSQDLQLQPSMTVPTAIGVSNNSHKPAHKATGLEDLDFHIGHDALSNSATYSVSYPVRHGMVSLAVRQLMQEQQQLLCAVLDPCIVST